MIDLGLLASILVAAAAPWVVAKFVRARHRRNVDGDTLTSSALIGLVAARLAFVVLDDPAAFGRLGDLLIIRSGVEFWPGLAAGAVFLALRARRSGVPIPVSLSVGAPLFLVGYGGYEATCALREGCFGPSSPVGLTPLGFGAAVFPVGWAVAAVTVGAGLALRRLDLPDARIPLLALLVVAAARAIAGFHLPRVGSGLTRAHLESLWLVAVSMVALWGVGALKRPTTSSKTALEDSSRPTDPEPRKGP